MSLSANTFFVNDIEEIKIRHIKQLKVMMVAK